MTKDYTYPTSKKFVDLSNRKYNFLTVKKYAYKSKGVAYFVCTCDCGKETIVSGGNLSTSHTMSCGCKKNLTAHGLSKHHAYKIWKGIQDRCENKDRDGYKNYGGRGIFVCDEWVRSCETFVEWAESNGYKKGLTIERVNNDGNYEPSNCRWIPLEEQAYNRRNTKLSKMRVGVIRKLSKIWSQAKIAKIYGVDSSNISHILSNRRW